MTRLVILVFSVLGSWGGWALGERVGLMTAVTLSGPGGVLGVYLGWRAARDWLD